MSSSQSAKTQGALKGDGTKVTERAQNVDFRRKPQISQIHPFPGNSSIWRVQETAENRRFSQETADSRKKPQETADWALSP